MNRFSLSLPNVPNKQVDFDTFGRQFALCCYWLRYSSNQYVNSNVSWKILPLPSGYKWILITFLSALFPNDTWISIVQWVPVEERPEPESNHLPSSECKYTPIFPYAAMKKETHNLFLASWFLVDGGSNLLRNVHVVYGITPQRIVPYNSCKFKLRSSSYWRTRTEKSMINIYHAIVLFCQW